MHASNPTRKRIVEFFLRGGEWTIKEIAKRTKIPKRTVDYNIKKLKEYFKKIDGTNRYCLDVRSIDEKIINAIRYKPLSDEDIAKNTEIDLIVVKIYIKKLLDEHTLRIIKEGEFVKYVALSKEQCILLPGLEDIRSLVEIDVNPHFSGRKKKIEFFKDLLEDVGSIDKSVLCLYGFGGMGKSTLMKKFLEISVDNGFRPFGAKINILPREHLETFFSTSFNIRAEQGMLLGLTYYLRKLDEKLKEAESKGLKIILFIDTQNDFIDIKNNWSKFNTSVGFLAKSMQNKKIFAVTATRDRPMPGVTLPIGYLEVKGFNLGELKEWAHKAGWTYKIIGWEKELIEKTKGNPWVIKLIISNDDTLEKFKQKKYKKLHKIKDIKLLFNEIWAAMDDELIKAAGTFAAIALFSPKIKNEICEKIILDWKIISKKLVDKSIIDEAGDDYAIHDFVREYAYDRLIDKEKTHEKIGDFYSKSDSVLALKHFVESKNLGKIEKVYEKAMDKIEQNSDYIGIENTANKILEKFNTELRLDEKFKCDLFMDIGYAYRMQSLYKKSLNLYKKIVYISKKLKNKNNEATSYRSIGEAYKMLNKHKEALVNFKKAKEIFEISKNEKGKALSLWSIGDTYSILVEYEEALFNLKEAKEIFEKIGEDYLYGFSLLSIGEIYRVTGKYKEAIDHYKKSINICKKTGTTYIIAWNLRGIAWINMMRGKYKEALRGLKEAKEIFEKIGHKHGEATVILATADIYRILNKFECATDMYETAKEIFECMENERGSGWTLNWIASLYRNRNQYEKALEYYKKAENIFKNIGDEFGEIYSLFGIAEIYRINKEYTKSKTKYEESLFKAKESKLRVEISHAMIGIAEIKRIQGTYDLSDYEEPLKIYKETGVPWGIVNTLIGRALAHLQNKNEKQFEKDLKEARRICKEEFTVPSGMELPELELIDKILKERNPKELHPLNF